MDMNMNMAMHAQGGGQNAGPAMAVAPEHAIAMLALLFFPPILLGIAAMVEMLSRRYAPMERLANAIGTAPITTNVAVVLMLMTAAIHLVLIPAHLSEDPTRAALFTLNGAAFIAASIAAYTWPAWRLPAATLGAASIATYALYVVTGREAPDVVGLLTTVIEGGAILAIAASAAIRRDISRIVPAH